MENQIPIIAQKSQSKWLAMTAVATLMLGAFWYFFGSLENFQSSVTLPGADKVPLFVTSRKFSGKLGGIEKANEICQRSAEIASLDGTWESFISSYSQNIKDKLPDKKYVLLKDGSDTEIEIAGSKTDLLDGTIKNPINRTEFLTTTDGAVWTGSNADGTASDAFCQPGQNGEGTFGSGGQTGNGWLNQGHYGCGEILGLYCYRVSETSPQVELSSETLTAGSDSTATKKSFTLPSSLGSLKVDLAGTGSNTNITAKTLRKIDTAKLPKSEGGKPLKILRTFELTPSNEFKNVMQKAILEFDIPEAEILKSGIGKDSLRMGKLHNGKWRKLDLVKVSESAPTNSKTNVIRYRLEFREFSSFILTSDAMLSDPFCGDGERNQAEEQCDTGGDSTTCTAQCSRKEYCGDGAMNGNEQCDDGNANNTDGCSNACATPVCGDGIKQGSEVCEDGNQIETDACLNNCQTARCGDGKVQTGVDACDDGNTNDDDDCSNTCKTPVCGDNKKQGVETCDDGNTAADDGCSAICKLELVENKVKDLAFQDLIAYYPFDEAGAEVKDSSGNNRHGKIMDAKPVIGATDGRVTNTAVTQNLINHKDFGKALKLTPETYVDLNDMADFNGGPMTISFWASPEKMVNSNPEIYGGGLFNKMTEQGKGWNFGLSQPGFLLRAASSNNNGSDYDATDYGINSGSYRGWNHYTIILDSTSLWTFRDSSKFKIYLNGNNITGNIWPNPTRTFGTRLGFQGPTDIPDQLYIGGLPLSNNHGVKGNFTGLIDELRFYKRALSEKEIQALALANVAAQCGNAIMDRGEPCDDGNTNEDDGCNVACELPVCGDGKKQGAEQCDDGDTVDDAACSANCRKWGAGITIIQQTINDGYPGGQKVVRLPNKFPYHVTGNLSPKDFELDSDTDATVPYLKEWGTWRNPNTVESGKYIFEQLGKAGGYRGFQSSFQSPGKAVTRITITEDKDQNSKISNPPYNFAQINIAELNLDPDETILVTYKNYLLPECSDTFDNDDDGKIDFKADGSGDPSCSDANDNDEQEYLPAGKEGEILVRHVTKPSTRYDANNPWDPNSPFVGPYSLKAQSDNLILKRSSTPGTYVIDTLKTPRHTVVSTRPPDGFTFQGIQCEESVTANSAVDGAVAKIILDPSETVTCDYIFTKNQACQNGTKDPGEQCDDGNEIDTDACTNKCENTRCGDSIINPATEQCDDGNTINTDTCKNDCSAAKCGDNVLQTGVEKCDDGNTTDGDGCDRLCKIEPGCGNAQVDPGEECDDGNSSNTDGCLNTCRNPTCGDGFKRPGIEQCDDGNTKDDDACTAACKPASCGDGITWAGVEQCDDGNNDDADSCTIRCNGFGAITLKLDVNPDDSQDFVFERTFPVAGSNWDSTSLLLDDDQDGALKNAKTWPAESSLGGHAVRLPTLPLGFEIEEMTWIENKTQNSRVHPVEPRAMSISLEPNEEITVTFKMKKKSVCSDNIDNDGDGNKDYPADLGCENATDTDEIDPVCNDGKKERGEECDDGNVGDTKACVPGCKVAKCGDGLTQAGVEACDDGNTIDTDACLNSCALARCGDRIVRKNVEQCDLGEENGRSGKTCSRICQELPYLIPRKNEEWNAE